VALVLTEPFNNFTAAPWTLVAPNPTIVTGRTGTAAQVTLSGCQLNYNVSTPDQTDTVTIGFAWRTTNLNSDLLFLRSDAGATDHNRINITSTGQIIFSRAGTSIASSATGLVAINTWNYLEVQAKLSDTVGTVTVRLNGTAVITATGLDTKNAGTKTVYDQIRFSTLDGRVYLIDDLYLRNDAVFQGDPTVGFSASGSGAIAFAGAGVATVSVVASGSGAIAFAGAGVATADEASEWLRQVEGRVASGDCFLRC
jgi:hypothetical protein